MASVSRELNPIMLKECSNTSAHSPDVSDYIPISNSPIRPLLGIAMVEDITL